MNSAILIILFSLASLTFGINICPTREVTLSSGVVSSPNYPNKYPANTECTLTIKQPLDTVRFLFNFSKMDLGGNDKSKPCDASLNIAGKWSGEFCRAHLHYNYDRSLSHLTLRFKSSGNSAGGSGTGFKLAFTAVKDPSLPTPISVCPSRVIKPDTVGRISSPGYPNNYPNNLACTLTMQIPLIKKLAVKVNDNDIKDKGWCTKDVLMFSYDSGFTKSCGGWSGGSYQRIYDDSTLKIRFHSNGSGSGRGFILKYELFDRFYKRCLRPTGNEYIKRSINMADLINRANDRISLQFKTKEANGLLVYIKGTNPNSFILLKLQNGTITYEVDFETGNLDVTVPSNRLDDEKWHNVVVERRGKDVNVTVDDTFQASAQIPGNFAQLQNNAQSGVDTGVMYVLGGPSDIVPFPVNFKGLAIKFVINDMRPIPSYLAKDPKYTASPPYGFGRIPSTFCSDS